MPFVLIDEVEEARTAGDPTIKPRMLGLADEAAQPPDITKELEEGIPEPGKPFMESAAEFGAPMVGSVGGALIGGRFGGAAGSRTGAAIGAGLGRGAVEGMKKLIPGGADPTGMEILRDASVEAGFDLAGGLALKGIGKIPAVKNFVNAAAELGKNRTIPVLTKMARATGKLLQATLEMTTEGDKARMINTMANRFKIKNGIPELATRRGYERGFKKVLSPENFNINDLSMKRETLEQTGKIVDEAFEVTRKEFNDRVLPALKNNKSKIDLGEPINDFVNEMEGQFTAKIKADGTVRLMPDRAAVDQPVANLMNRFDDDLTKLGKNPTAENIHKFKQEMNSILKKSTLNENKVVQNAMFKLKSGVVNKLQEAVPAYKPLMNEYRGLFEMEEFVGSKFDMLRAESFLHEYFQPNKQGLRSFVDDLVKINPAAKEALDKALDERAALYFRDMYSAGGPALRVPFVRADLPIGRGNAPEKAGRSLLRREARGTLSPLFNVGSAARGAGAFETGQQIKGQARRLIRTTERKE